LQGNNAVFPFELTALQEATGQALRFHRKEKAQRKGDSVNYSWSVPFPEAVVMT
jgi:hypothetical protein